MSAWVAGTFLGSGDRAVNQINKNVCPSRAFILMGDTAKKKRHISKMYEC